MNNDGLEAGGRVSFVQFRGLGKPPAPSPSLFSLYTVEMARQDSMRVLAAYRKSLRNSKWFILKKHKERLQEIHQNIINYMKRT